MEATISLTVNGKLHTITADPQRPLLDVLREELKLTGTKYGCGEGQCLACTVLVGGKPMPSCVTPVGDVEKQSILTIEGLSKAGELHPVQEAFLTEGAFQCGYCTAGMILGAVNLIESNPGLTAGDVQAGMQRHLCRCGTYPNITKAILRAASNSHK